MPGIYVNDGGQLGSGLAAAIAGIANDFSPKTQAEAALLKQQMEEANWNNRLLSSKVPAVEGQITAAGALPGKLGADIAGVSVQPTGGPAASVGGPGATTTNPIVSGSPETQRGVASPATGLFGALLAGRAAQGGDMNDLRSGLEVAQQATQGPANTYEVQKDLAIKRGTPVTMHAGDVYNSNPGGVGGPPSPPPGGPPPAPPVGGGPAPGVKPVPAAPNVTLSGGSVYDKTREEEQAKTDNETFQNLAAGGDTALTGLQKLGDLRTLYNSVVGNTTTGEILSTAAQSALLSKFGVAITTKAGALTEINKALAELIGEKRSAFGVQRMAGPEITALKNSLPTASMPAPAFNDVLNRMEANLQQEKAAGAIAQQVQAGKLDAATGRAQITKILANDPIAEIRSKYPSLFQGGAGGGGAPKTLRAPTAAESSEFHDRVAKGGSRQDMINNARANGVDMSGVQ